MVLTTFSELRAQSDPEEYKRQLDAATEVYNSGDLSLALIAYLEVRSRFSGPEVDYSLARTYHRLHQCVSARTFYAYVMNSYDLPEKNPLYQRAANYFDELYSCDQWGQVELECSTQDGVLSVNGEKLGACMKSVYQLPAGMYKFSLEKAGLPAVEQSVDVSDGSMAKVKLELPSHEVVERIVEVPAPVLVEQSSTNWLVWGLIGGGGLLLASSAYFNAAGYSAMVDVQKAADRGDLSARKSAEDDVSTQQVLTGVTFGVGLAVLATGVTFAILDAVSEPEVETDTGVSLMLSSEGAGLLWRTGF
jgi:hypothetical protein